jgi:hypothetical protein
VIQITQGRSDHQSADDAAASKTTLRGLQHLAVPIEKSAVMESRHYQCDLNHIPRFEPILWSQHQNVMHASLQALTVRIGQ